MAALWTIAANPRKKRRSPAQRAATARMLTANRGKRRASPKRRARARRASPVASIMRRARRAVGGMRRRASRRGMSLGTMSGGIVGTLKTAAFGAGGAIVVDLGYGVVSGYLPASMQTKTDSAGNVNYMYYAAKGALAFGLGAFGGKIMGRETAQKMAAGSLVVMAYELLRPLAASVLPSSMSLGYFTPATTLPGLNAYANTGASSGMGNVRGLRAYANSNAGADMIKSPMASSGMGYGR